MSLVNSETTVTRMVAGRNACSATAAGTKQGEQDIALARAAAIGQAGSRAKAIHTTPAATRKTRVPVTHSRGQTSATDSTRIALSQLYTNQPCRRRHV